MSIQKKKKKVSKKLYLNSYYLNCYVETGHALRQSSYLQPQDIKYAHQTVEYTETTHKMKSRHLHSLLQDERIFCVF